MSSETDTKSHILRVKKLLTLAISEMYDRQQKHDISKLSEPEKSLYDKLTPLLKDSTYGSEEYYQFLKELKPALDHHYKVNRHHPEFYNQGIDGMNLIDLLEMICDWIAASERHKNGNVLESIEINQKRFNYSDQLKKIFINTVNMLKSQ